MRFAPFLWTPADRGAAAAARVSLLADPLCGRSLSVLIFHRVLPQPDPLFPGEMHAAAFDRLMGLVARCFHVLPLAMAVRRLGEGSLPPRALAITFDDGYADNHDVALPILQRHGLGACFFIATGFLDGGRMFNDTVIECLRRTRLDHLDGEAFGLGRLPISGPAQRAAAIGQLLPKIKYLAPLERGPALTELLRQCAPPDMPDDLMMRRGQVQALQAAGMEIGAHTVHHPILSTLSDDQAREEMTASRESLQALIDQPVTLFAYPNGRPDRDYHQVHARLARQLGFAAAVTTAPGVARADADLFQLPRFTPWDRLSSRWLLRLAARRWQRDWQRASH